MVLGTIITGDLILLRLDASSLIIFAGSQLAQSEEERILDGTLALIQPEDIHHFSFPTYKAPDTKDDMVSQ